MAIDKVRCGVCGRIDSLSDGADFGLCSAHVLVRNDAERTVRPVSALDAALSESVRRDADARERAIEKSVRRYRRASAGLRSMLRTDAAWQDKARAIGARMVAERAAADAEMMRSGSRSAGAVPVGKMDGAWVSSRDRRTLTLSEHRAAGERAARAADKRTQQRRAALVSQYRAHAQAAHARWQGARYGTLGWGTVVGTLVRRTGASSNVTLRMV